MLHIITAVKASTTTHSRYGKTEWWKWADTQERRRQMGIVKRDGNTGIATAPLRRKRDD